MPTGYTADIAKGISFPEYAMGCARAFGALVTMRDDPADAPIPEAFEPESYYAKSLREAEARHAELIAMTPAQAEAAATADYEEKAAYRAKWLDEKRTLRMQYVAMLNQVRAWEPPTQDHVELKRFMIEQIATSIDHDCNESYCTPPTKQTGQEWHQEQQKEATRRLERAAGEHAKEVARAVSRTSWVAKLRASLAGLPS